MLQPNHDYALGAPVTGNTLIYTGTGTLQGVIVSSHTSGTIKFFDSIVDSGTVLLPTYTYATGSSSINFKGLKFVNGLYADTGGTTQIVTVLYNPYQG